MTDEEFSTGPLDVATLQALAQRAGTHPLVEDWAFQPDATTPRLLEIRLDVDQYPPAVGLVRLDVRWFEGDGYTVHYVETRDDTVWQCRWNRHPKPGEPRAHFHPPPDAADEVEASELSGTHYIDVLFDVLDWTSGRLERLHE